jgi:LPXTG-site transpeptidase (sortase) family protein
LRVRPTRRAFLVGLGATGLAAAACTGLPAGAPSPTPTSAAPALAATIAASVPRPAAAPPSAEVAAGLPTPTPTLIPPKPTVTPTPRPVVPTPTPGSAPQAIEIAKIGVSAPIKGIGTTPTGEMGAPDGPFDVGWFIGSPKPGDPGNAVLTGHLDWAGPPARTAVFWELKKLGPGDDIVVRTERDALTFRVESTTLYERRSAPVEQILGWAMGKILTIVTCEGMFIPEGRDYTHRRVVRARLVI